MQYYKLIYKCRQCGDKVTTPIKTKDNEALETHIATTLTTDDYKYIPKHIMHSCRGTTLPDTLRGICDLAGFKRLQKDLFNNLYRHNYSID